MTLRLKLAATAALLAALALTVDVAAALAAAAALDPRPAAAALALFLATHAVNAWRLALVFPGRTFPVLLGHTLAAQGYALLLPGQLAGEAVKAYRLGRGGEGFLGAATAVAFDKTAAILGILLVTLSAALVEHDRFGPLPALLSGGALALLAGAAAAAAWDPAARIADPLRRAGRRGRDTARRLERAFVLWRTFARHPRTLALTLAGALAAQLLAVAGTRLLALGLGIDLPAGAWAVVLGVLTVILLAPLTVGGIGLRELSLIGLLAAQGVPAAQAVALGLAILGVQVIAALIGVAADFLLLDRR